MRAYAVTAYCEAIEPLDRADPVPKGTEVIVDVTRCGVCHSDLHLHEGYYSLGGGKKLSLADRGVSLPLVLGHEVLGKLVAKGPDAPISDDQIGKTFVVYPWLGCGTCDLCKADQENLCPKPNAIGVHRAGGYAEKCVVPHPKYLIDATGLPPSLAATYACSGLTAYSALKKATIDKNKDVLLVIGAGGVGLSAVQIGKALGFKAIAIADIDAGKRDVALKAGAFAALDPMAEDAVRQAQSLPGGVAAVIDFVGSSTTAAYGMEAVRKAGIYIAVGLFGGDFTMPVPMLIWRALTLRGSYVGDLRELRELLDLVRQGKIAPLPVEDVPMAQVNDALERLRAGKVTGRLVLARDA